MTIDDYLRLENEKFSNLRAYHWLKESTEAMDLILGPAREMLKDYD